MRAVAAEAVERLRQAGAQTGDVARVLAQRGGRELGVQHGHRGRRGGVAEGFAPTFQSLVGDDAEPDRVHGLPVEAAHRRGLAAHVERDAGPVGLDGGDLHGAASWAGCRSWVGGVTGAAPSRERLGEGELHGRQGREIDGDAGGAGQPDRRGHAAEHDDLAGLQAAERGGDRTSRPARPGSSCGCPIRSAPTPSSRWSPSTMRRPGACRCRASASPARTAHPALPRHGTPDRRSASAMPSSVRSP